MTSEIRGSAALIVSLCMTPCCFILPNSTVAQSDSSRNSISPGLISQIPEKGAKYGVNFVDSNENPITGDNNYRINLLANIHAANFWSITLNEAENVSSLQYPDGGTEIHLGQNVNHNLGGSYHAFVFCIDRSLSPTDEQFHKLQAVMETIVEKDITYNDLVWLIEIQSVLEPVKMFEMPPARPYRRSNGPEPGYDLQASKTSLINAIQRMSQVAGHTDLQSSLEAALAILQSQPAATSRNLVIGSDFITDTKQGKPSMDPPKESSNNSAKSVRVVLLVTNPKADYLRNLGISSFGLLMHVETRWASYFKSEGASPVAVSWVDAIPVLQGGQNGKKK